MPTLSLSVLFEFSASHRLYRPDLSEQENRKLYGKCSNPNGHGHNYTLIVNVAGPVESTTEMIIDASLLKELVEREVLQDVDHKDLNRDTPWLEGRVPTTEVVAHAIFNRLADAISKVSGTAQLESITLQETRRISVTVTR
jgi:6-pyruvoyltetrahydropterin/6-carboxytetrahydropterin synthase